MSETKGAQAYMSFISKLTQLMSDYSHDDLEAFVHQSQKNFPTVAPVLIACMQMMAPEAGMNVRRRWKERISSNAMDRNAHAHLFDLLRSKELFPTNGDLATFAGRILPGMDKKRFDKMSRADIAARIIEYLETQDSIKSRRLQTSMRNAMARNSSSHKTERESFFSQWESIIKGIPI
jgi:hypothetical protein